MNNGKSVNILHVGSYDEEFSSFEKMDLFCKENGWLENMIGIEKFIWITLIELRRVNWKLYWDIV